MANHWQTQILWILFLLNWYFQNNDRSFKRVIFCLTIIVIGISLYIYLPLRAFLNCTPSWGYPINYSLFYWEVSRQLVKGLEPWIQGLPFYLESLQEILKIEMLLLDAGFYIIGRIWIGSSMETKPRPVLIVFSFLRPDFYGGVFDS